MYKLPIILTSLIIVVACEPSISIKNEERMNYNNKDKIELPNDRRLSFNEAMALRASDISLRILDPIKMQLLEEYSKNPKEINAQYAWATYQIWHENKPSVETQGYQSIFKLAELGHPYACANVYTWSYESDIKFIENTMGLNYKDILAIKDRCLGIALEYNANSIKYKLIEKFFSDNSRGKDYSDLNIISKESIKDVEQETLENIKEYLIMYLFSWDNQFMNNIPGNNLANGKLISLYLQLLAYDPYEFNSIESCAWLKYYDDDFIPYLKAKKLPNIKIIEEKLINALPILRVKLQETQIDENKCQSRYLQIRDTKRDNRSFILDFY